MLLLPGRMATVQLNTESVRYHEKRLHDAGISWYIVSTIITRDILFERIRSALDRGPVTVLTGALQSGKTTLARKFLSEESANYFDLEDPVSLIRLEESRTALEPLRGLVVIDEVQRRPDLFPICACWRTGDRKRPVS